MAKKQSASTISRISSQFASADEKQHIKSLDESRFFHRLNANSKQPGVSALITTVQHVWDLVDDVTKRVSQDFRDYTLHDMKHLGNVLWLMEQLVPPALWETPWTAGQPVGPLQCAVSILALLVHDLGMALPDDTRKKLLAVEDPEKTLAETTAPLDRDVIAYRRHFMAQEHDVRTMQTLERDKPDHYRDRVEHIRQQIRTEYLRQTHADDAIGGEHRICIGQRVFQWDNKDFEKSVIEFRKSDTGCPNPDILKGVSDYCGWIRQELAGVAKASQERSDSLPLRLPGHTEQHVKHDLQIDGGWDSQQVQSLDAPECAAWSDGQKYAASDDRQQGQMAVAAMAKFCRDRDEAVNSGNCDLPRLHPRLEHRPLPRRRPRP